MKRLAFIVVSLATIVLPAYVALAAPAPAVQLYGDKKDVTKGDLNDQDYWWAKFDDMMLELAVKQRQPEGRIGLQLATMTKRLDDLAKKYPKHEEIKRMRQHALDVHSKIPDDADRSQPFGAECPWEESNFAQIWVNVRWANASWAEKDYTNVQSLMQNVNSNLDIMLKPDRMKSYPPELRKSVDDAKVEATRLTKLVNDKLSPPSSKPGVVDASASNGDLNSQDYWWARFDDMMLDHALQERQPEGRIDLQLATALKRLDDLSRQFPNHEGIKVMKRKVEEVKAKIDPNADRHTPFAPEVPWEEANFAQLWVNLHHAQTAHAHGDDATASGLLGNIHQNQEIMLRADRMREYPADLKQWVEASKAQYEELANALKKPKRR